MSDSRDILATRHDANVTPAERRDPPPAVCVASSTARTRAFLRVACTLLTLFVVAGCVIPPPIITIEEEAYPPFISSEFVSPSNQIIQVTTDDAVTLELTSVFDQNVEDSLHVIWFSLNSGIIGQDFVFLVPDEDGRKAFDIYNTYGSSSASVFPCDPENANALSDTVWVYVSDQPFATVNSVQGVQERIGAFKTSYSWVLEFNVLCT